MTLLLGRKIKMDQVWQDAKVVPVTIIQAEPNTVSLVRTKERDGYEAVQMKSGRTRCEARGATTMSVGDIVDVSAFFPGDKVKVSGLTKGRGFQGVVKRHGFHGGPKTHGQKNRHRAPGSIGATAPQRVVPGMKMAGHMGTERVSVLNLVVVSVDPEKKLLLVRGAVPGHRNTMLEIRK